MDTPRNWMSRKTRTWITAAGGVVGGVCIVAALGAALGAVQPGTAAPAGPKWEYGALSRMLTTGSAVSGGTASEWRFCGPAEDLASESAIMGKYGGSGLGTQSEVAMINGLSAKGWELVTHSQAATYETKMHNGTTSADARVVLDQWWLRREKKPK
jgi:hypothetical protein